jgi:hypothetical protein
MRMAATDKDEMFSHGHILFVANMFQPNVASG